MAGSRRLLDIVSYVSGDGDVIPFRVFTVKDDPDDENADGTKAWCPGSLAHRTKNPANQEDPEGVIFILATAFLASNILQG